MRPNGKNESFTFHRNVFSSNANGHTKFSNCSRRLEDRFEDDTSADRSDRSRDRSVLSVLSLNDTRRAFRSGAEKISKTFSNVRTSLENFSQRFKPSTRRRQNLEEGPVTPNCSTPQTRLILGRTPTKLYSPFGIETPNTNPSAHDKENVRPVAKRADARTRKRNLLEDVF